jgi:hypothetical protein
MPKKDNNTNPKNNKQSEPTPMQSEAQEMGLSYDEIKEGLKRLLPLLEVAATLSENKYDDMAVEFLKHIVNA